VAHNEFNDLNFAPVQKENSILFDVKGIFVKEWVEYNKILEHQGLQ
jgi:UDP-N-acetyl-D-mannosaminuronate dehydrogenase